MTLEERRYIDKALARASFEIAKAQEILRIIAKNGDGETRKTPPPHSETPREASVIELSEYQ